MRACVHNDSLGQVDSIETLLRLVLWIRRARACVSDQVGGTSMLVEECSKPGFDGKVVHSEDVFSCPLRKDISVVDNDGAASQTVCFQQLLFTLGAPLLNVAWQALSCKYQVSRQRSWSGEVKRCKFSFSFVAFFLKLRNRLVCVGLNMYQNDHCLFKIQTKERSISSSSPSLKDEHQCTVSTGCQRWRDSGDKPSDTAHACSKRSRVGRSASQSLLPRIDRPRVWHSGRLWLLPIQRLVHQRFVSHVPSQHATCSESRTGWKGSFCHLSKGCSSL